VVANERATDQFVRDLLRDIGVDRPWEQDGGPKWKRDALRRASKSKAGAGAGKPEFVFESDGFVVVVEDKKLVSKTKYVEDGTVVTSYPQREDYALNGAVHYAVKMLSNGIPFNKGIFAVGVGGDNHHHEIAVAHVTPAGVTLLENLDTFDVFAADAIQEYYSVAVLGNKPEAEKQLEAVKGAAAQIHEGLRNYGSVENDRKAPLVSAILLALRKPSFTLDDLKGQYDEEFPDDWDGKRFTMQPINTCGQKDLGRNKKSVRYLTNLLLSQKLQH